MSAENDSSSGANKAPQDANAPEELPSSATPAPAPEEAGTSAPGTAASGTSSPPAEGEVDATALEAKIVEVLRTVYDPEIPVNIHELGMIYEVRVNPDDASAYVKMTLTTPACPVAGTLPGEVETKVASVPSVSSARVELVWDPPWNPGMMTEAAKLQTGLL